MKYGLDMTMPPTQQQAQTMRNFGWSFCGVYVPSLWAIAKSAWKQQDGVRYPVRDLSGIFDEFLPIYACRNTGDDPRNPWHSIGEFTYENGILDGEGGNIATGACGFANATPLAIDLEYGTYQAHPWQTHEYLRGIVESVNNAGHPAILYSDPYTISHIGGKELFDYSWVASHYNSATGLQEAPIGRFDPASPPPWDLWQFGHSVIAGVAVDLNSCSQFVKLAKYG